MTEHRKIRASEQEAIEAKAAAWIAQRDAGLSADEARAFEQWRTADPAHAAAVARLDRVWAALHELRDFRPNALSHPDADLLAPARRQRVVRFPVVGALASLAALLVLAFVLLRPRAHPDLAPTAAAQTYSTAAGGYQRVALEDGSVVELNANSEVQVRYTPAERHAMLLRGEAHFTVASNSQRPFWVAAGNIAVRAVGTAFDVRRGAHEVEVLVTAGRVRVDRDSVPVALGRAGTLLGAGWRATITHGTDPATVERIDGTAMRQELAWQSSRLVFVDTPLSEVVEEFNRHNEVQIVLGDPELGPMPIGGSFGAENVESFVRLLASNGDVRVERPSADRIVLRRGR